VLEVSFVARPGALAPRRRWPFDGETPAAERRSVEVGGVRSVKWKVRSGRTVIRAGIGVPGVKEAVKALNSCARGLAGWRGSRSSSGGEKKVWRNEGAGSGAERWDCGHTLQKSIDFTPLEPSAGPTGGDGEAWPAPTMSFTITSLPRFRFAMARDVSLIVDGDRLGVVSAARERWRCGSGAGRGQKIAKGRYVVM
jgi:hypothetical protein